MISYGRSIRWFNHYKDEVKFSKLNGFDFMQVWYFKGDIIVDRIEVDKKEFIKKCRFPIIFHAVFDISDFDEHVPKLFEILTYFNHHEVIIHPICEIEIITSETIYKLAGNVKKANEIFSKEGITLYIENNSRLDPINYHAEEVEILFSINPTVEFLLDIAHIDSYEHLKKLVNIKMPKMLHISDKHFNKIHEHLPIGHGDLDYQFIFTDILKDFQGKIIFEIVDEDNLIKNSKNFIKKIIDMKNQH
ncbi:sugar phosphate isomerase/epimerase [Mycoplasmatota bacterium]|nr:sugar phosphate isomerase/epimerase [Mycoplasmatota bacterium]